MLNLPSVTLFCADCYNAERAVAVVEHCKSKANFGAVKLLTHFPITYEHKVEIQNLPSLVDYSIFMLKRAVNYIDTPHVLIVQHDGYIINPDSWNPAWLNYDYIGPLFLQELPDECRMGSGGFSFRSKALMQYVDQHLPPWDWNPGSTELLQQQLGMYEDGVICHSMRRPIECAGFKFAPNHEACKFAQGGWPQLSSPTPTDARYFCERPFGFHGGWRNINLKTGLTQPPPFTPAI